MRASLPPAALACLLAACSTLPVDPGPPPAVDTATLGPDLRARLEPVLAGLEAAGPDAALLGKAGMLLHAYGQHETAVAFYVQASAIAPASPRWLYYRGSAQLELGLHEEARAAFQECLAVAPEMTAAGRGIADAAFASGAVPESLSLYRQVTDVAPGDARAHFGLGRAARAVEDLEVARRHLNRAVELAPQYGAAHYELAMLARDEGDDRSAQSHLQRYKQHQYGLPSDTDPLTKELRSLRVSTADLLQRAVEAKDAGRHEEAVRLHVRALEEDPSLVQARVNLIILHGSVGQDAEAKQQYELALAKGAETAELHYNYGVVAYQQGDRPAAKEAFGKALEHNPAHALANHNMGQMLEEEGRFDEAMDRYLRALASRPDHGLSHYKVGMLHMRKRQARAAIQSFREAIKEPSDRRPTYLFSLAAAELAAGNDSQATERFREARQAAVQIGQSDLVRRIDDALRRMQR